MNDLAIRVWLTGYDLLNETNVLKLSELDAALDAHAAAIREWAETPTGQGGELAYEMLERTGGEVRQ